MSTSPFLLSARATVWLRCSALVLVVIAAAAVEGMIAQRSPGLPFGVVYLEESRAWTAQDFSSHFQFSRHLWLNDLAHPYTVAGHEAMMSAWIGRSTGGALPYGYTPTFALVLAPLLPLPPVLAYLLWVLLPALGISFCIWRWAGQSERNVRVQAALLVTAGFSSTFIRSAQLGQTAVWSALMLLAIFYPRPKAAASLLTGFLLFLLTAKPPLAITAALALWWSGQRRPVFVAMVFTLAWIGMVTLWLGPSWIGDYVALLTHYNLDDAPPSLATSLEPNRMSNLRNFLYGFHGLSDHFCSRASTLAWVAGCGIFSWLLRNQRLDRLSALALSLAVYEAFCPHLTYTEDLMVVGILWFMATQPEWKSRLWFLIGLLFVVLNVGPGKLFFQAAWGAQVVFLLKLGLLVWVTNRVFKSLSISFSDKNPGIG